MQFLQALKKSIQISVGILLQLEKRKNRYVVFGVKNGLFLGGVACFKKTRYVFF